MIKNRLILILGVVIASLLGASGLVLNFYLSERDSRVIAEQTARQNEKALVSYSESVESHIEYYTTEIDHLNIKFDSARNESNQFKKKLAEYDLEKEARNDPEKLETNVNKATADLFFNIEKASGR